MATGDDHGVVKLSYIFPFKVDMKKDSNSNKNTSGEQNSSPTFSENMKAVIEAHEGTVFSINFVPCTYGNVKKRELIMATGSNDRIVRLWKIVSTKERVYAIPHMLLSTMSSSVLCINSTYVPGGCPIQEDMPDTDVPVPLGHSLNGSGRRSRIWSHRGSTIIVTAGTSAGAVYLWNLTSDDLYRPDFGENTPISHTICGRPNECPRDDGHRLKSLVFASEKPVVHVSPALKSCMKESLLHGKSVQSCYYFLIFISNQSKTSS